MGRYTAHILVPYCIHMVCIPRTCELALYCALYTCTSWAVLFFQCVWHGRSHRSHRCYCSVVPVWLALPSSCMWHQYLAAALCAHVTEVALRDLSVIVTSAAAHSSSVPPSSTSAHSLQGVKKPYNPIIGETFAAAWRHEDGSISQYVAEQVLHRPPVTALYFENRQRGIVINGQVHTRYVATRSGGDDG